MAQEFPRGGSRLTTVIRLSGGGHEGIGEDVIYASQVHLALDAWDHTLPLVGEYTVDSFSRQLDETALFPTPPERNAEYRRWGFEAAALDLALRQASTTLHAVLEREPRPVAFAASMGLGDHPSLERIERVLVHNPKSRFKLDPTVHWSDEFVRESAATASVDVMDFKGHYIGDWVDNAPDPALYARIANGFPDAWLEDPMLTPGTEAVLASHRARITWDAMIHSVDDVRARREGLRCVNIKPSRFGTVRKLMDAYDYCEAEGLAMYGGGQFELGPGRGQIQYLASLFHPESSNDVAPAEYNLADLPATLPASPLAPTPSSIGFRWGAD